MAHPNVLCKPDDLQMVGGQLAQDLLMFLGLDMVLQVRWIQNQHPRAQPAFEGPSLAGPLRFLLPVPASRLAHMK